MGFRIYYRTTRPVDAGEAAALRAAARRSSAGRTWLHCEPVSFYEYEPDDDGHLMGGSKPNFRPHPDDVASAAREDRPDGDVRDLIDVLRGLSRDHGVDWEIRHDHEPGPVGYIRGGVCDPGLIDRADALADLAELLGELEDGGPVGDDPGPDDDQDDDDGPRILRLWGD